jgi:hypothetical protein
LGCIAANSVLVAPEGTYANILVKMHFVNLFLTLWLSVVHLLSIAGSRAESHRRRDRYGDEPGFFIFCIRFWHRSACRLSLAKVSVPPSSPELPARFACLPVYFAVFPSFDQLACAFSSKLFVYARCSEHGV